MKAYLSTLLLATLLGSGSVASAAPAHSSTGEPGAESSLGVGACSACHDESDRPTNPSDDSNDGCNPCHSNASLRGIFPGRAAHELSIHRLDQRVQWPGSPGPVSPTAGSCVQCHDPHGRRDGSGRIGALLLDRDPNLCLRCHDGRVAAGDIASELRKPYSHGVRRAVGRHDAAEPENPSSYSYTGGRRHVGCSDCHNPHLSTPSTGATRAPQAPAVNDGVSRIRVFNGPAGSQPRYQFVPASDTAREVLEYEICFKCHSSWTQSPPGQEDLGRRLNPANRSHHAVEAPGNNPRLDPRSFVDGWGPDSLVLCSDCHGSDDSATQGPHGSTHVGMLRAPYVQSSVNDRELLCFRCHDYDTYGDASGFNLGASRFNPPAAVGGHARHVGAEGIHCSACHESHGSFDLPALLSDARGPQLLRIRETADGGSCQSGCHDTREYRRNYPW